MNGFDPMTAGRNDEGVLALKKIFQSAWIYRLLRIRRRMTDANRNNHF
jgi:hypothetical protein